MTIAQQAISYCTNVHPGLSVREIEAGLSRYTHSVCERVGGGLAAGLWLAAPVIAELESEPEATLRFRDFLLQKSLPCYTLNAFPYGNFHTERVKQNVYLPDWTAPERLAYTLGCARILATLLPDSLEGSISTVPLGFKDLCKTNDFESRAIQQLLECARGLERIFDQTGRRIRLAIEPEPLCVLETTNEAIGFFQRLFEAAAERNELDMVRQTLGLCYDVCHQAVEFENVAQSLRRIDDAGIRLNKIHISCAIELRDPMNSDNGRTALEAFIEPRYLHQTMGRLPDGSVIRFTDLASELIRQPPEDLARADSWRIHYHVPVDAETIGPLHTTRSDLKQALETVARLKYAPHLEIETYTWNVLPEAEQPDLVTGLTNEVLATRRLLDELEPPRVE